MMVKWRIETPEEEAARKAAEPPWVKAREEFDKKHPRCDACGQFLKRRTVIEMTELYLELRPQSQSEWISHYVQDYWGEWDHI